MKRVKHLTLSQVIMEGELEIDFFHESPSLKSRSREKPKN